MTGRQVAPAALDRAAAGILLVSSSSEGFAPRTPLRARAPRSLAAWPQREDHEAASHHTTESAVRRHQPAAISRSLARAAIANIRRRNRARGLRCRVFGWRAAAAQRCNRLSTSAIARAPHSHEDSHDHSRGHNQPPARDNTASGGCNRAVSGSSDSKSRMEGYEVPSIVDCRLPSADCGTANRRLPSTIDDWDCRSTIGIADRRLGLAIVDWDWQL